MNTHHSGQACLNAAAFKADTCIDHQQKAHYVDLWQAEAVAPHSAVRIDAEHDKEDQRAEHQPCSEAARPEDYEKPWSRTQGSQEPESPA